MASISENHQTPFKIVFIRHGHSEWNGSGRFTGWYDCDLTDEGVIEAQNAAKIIEKEVN